MFSISNPMLESIYTVLMQIVPYNIPFTYLLMINHLRNLLTCPTISLFLSLSFTIILIVTSCYESSNSLLIHQILKDSFLQVLYSCLMLVILAREYICTHKCLKDSTYSCEFTLCEGVYCKVRCNFIFPSSL